MAKTNLTDVRIQNANLILRELELHDGTTNTDIALTYHLSIPTVTKIINILGQNEMIHFTGSNRSSGGRRAKRISLNPEYQYFVGLSITKHIIYYSVIDFTGRVLDDGLTYHTFEDTAHYWEIVHAYLCSITDRLKVPYSCALALPGILDEASGQILALNSLDVNALKTSHISRHIGSEVGICSSSKVSGLAQLHGKETYANSVFITLNRHVSGVLILNNEIFTLSQFDCAFADMVISRDEQPSEYYPVDTHPGSVAALCSASRIISTLREQGIPDLYDGFFEDMKNGNEYYAQLWDEYLGNLAIALHNIHAMFGLDVVVGGEMANFLPEYYDDLCCRIDRYDHLIPARDYLYFSEYARMDSAIGAALYMRKNFINENLPFILQKANDEA